MEGILQFAAGSYVFLMFTRTPTGSDDREDCFHCFDENG